MKAFKKSERHLSKHTKAKPNIRLSVTRKRILERQEMRAYSTMKRREERAKIREDRVERLGLSLIKAMEWGYMRKHLHRSTKLLSKEKKFEKQKEIAEVWAERRARVEGIRL